MIFESPRLSLETKDLVFTSAKYFTPAVTSIKISH